MGFGLLFIGYFVSYVMSYAFIPKLLGCIIMLFGVRKLSEYEIKFKLCVPVLIAMCVTSAYIFTEQMLSYFKISSFVSGELAVNIVSVGDEVLGVIFHVFLLLAIGKLAHDTELEKVRVSAIRNLVLVGLAEISYITVLVLPDSDFKLTFFRIAFGLRLIWIVLDLALLVSCYRQICDESDVDMPDREINIPVIKHMEKVLGIRDKNAFDSGKNWSEKRRNKKSKKK